MSLVLDYMKQYLDEDKDNVVIIEGLNGSGKSTICSQLMGRYPYFKHIGAMYHDGILYDSSIIKTFRVFDRYKPIQDFVIGAYDIYGHQMNQLDMDERYVKYACESIREFTEKYLPNKKPLFVYLLHHRYLTEEAKRARAWINDDYLYWYKRGYDYTIEYLSRYYRVLMVTDSTVKIIYGDL